jgi:hypothetical protein
MRRHALTLSISVLLALSGCSCGETPEGHGVDTGSPPFDAGDRPDALPGSDAAAEADASSADALPSDAQIDPRDPNNTRRDTDCDGLSDAYELATAYPDGSRTDPTRSDSDGDGIPDGVEAGVSGPVSGSGCTQVATDADPSSRTSPTSPDTDGDGIPDGIEDRNHDGSSGTGESDPRLRDTDGDAIPDGIEDRNHDGSRDPTETDATSRDTDQDGISDGLEDQNHDGVRDPSETDPLLLDSDSDGLADGDEDTNHNGVREAYEVDPRTPDTDCDGISDDEELTAGTSPLLGDSDGDGLPDGLERARVMALAGSSCPNLTPDADPSTTTIATAEDSDNDSIPDGLEDVNQNGRVDPGESDPNNPDTDGDGLPDGDELAAGTDPTDRTSPPALIAEGMRAVCSDANLAPTSFDIGAPGAWTVAHAPSLSYAPVAVSNASVHAAALDSNATGLSAFVLEMPPIGGAALTARDQHAALATRFVSGAAGLGLSITLRQSPRSITSHDGFEALVSGVWDVTVMQGAIDASSVRASLLALSSGLQPSDFTGLPNGIGMMMTQYSGSIALLVRPSDQTVLVIGGVLDRTRFNDPMDARAIPLLDLTNGTALALREARRSKGCDPFEAAGISVADFIWMADISASTDDDRGRIVSAAQEVFDALTRNNVDFRMGVVPHSQSTIHQPTNAGNLRGMGFTRSRGDFAAYLQDASGTDGCEFGLDAVDAAINRSLPRSVPGQEDARKLRANATLAVVYVGDEHAQEVEEGPCFNLPQRRGCPTGIGDVWTRDANVCAVPPNAQQQACVDQLVAPYISTIRREGGIAFGQVVSPTPVGACTSGQFACPNSTQDRNEGGRGYVEVISATGGISYSPCESNPGAGSLQAIVDAVTGAASQFQLRATPISASLKVGVSRQGRATTIVPRDRQSGFDYDPVSNSIFFRGTSFRPEPGDLVTISYRVWRPPVAPCGGSCAANQVCDGQLQVCGCDLAECSSRCGPSGVCGADCACACPADCNGQCGQGQVCNPSSCACECAADCGGCPQGTTCNPSSCQCECTDCGGTCDASGGSGNLACNSAACACECPADCGGACAGGSGSCNPSTCACECAPSCDQGCNGNARCDPQDGCACACPADCGGCQDGTTCNSTSCTCECPAGCSGACPNRQVCDPNNGCGCFCPPDCGGCSAGETCDPTACRCVPAV